MVYERELSALRDSFSLYLFDMYYDELDIDDRKTIDLIIVEDFGGVLDEKGNPIRMRYIP